MPELMIEDDRRLLAGEYVLGTLDADEITRVKDLLDQDPQFRDWVSTWERRLGELHLMVEPVESAPEVWQRIKAWVAAVPPTVAAPEVPVAAQAPAELSLPEEIVKSEETTTGIGSAAEPEFAQFPTGHPLPNPAPQAGEGREGASEDVGLAAPAAAVAPTAAAKETAPAEQPIAVAKEETAQTREAPTSEAPTREETIAAKQEAELVEPVAFQPQAPEPSPKPQPLPTPAPPTEPSRTLRLDILPDATGERQKAAPEPNRKKPLPGRGAGGWPAVAAVATFIAVGLAGLIASWRYLPDRLPPQLRPTVLLNMTAQPENPARRPPLPEAQFQE